MVKFWIRLVRLNFYRWHGGRRSQGVPVIGALALIGYVTLL
jgi:hypothetical protein